MNEGNPEDSNRRLIVNVFSVIITNEKIPFCNDES